jgi:hypothetical protein
VAAVEYFEVQLGSLIQTPKNSAALEVAAATSKLPWIGKVCVVADDESDASNLYRYEYSPLFSRSAVGIEECLAWKPSAGVLLESCLWWVKDYFTTTVLRNPRWWEEVGCPAYTQFWVDAMEARATGRFVRESVPLFVEMSDSEESVQKSPDDEGETGDHTNAESSDDDASVVEGWQGGESDQEYEDLEEALQSDTPLNLECVEDSSPLHT